MYLGCFDGVYFNRMRKAGKLILIKSKLNTKEGKNCLEHFKIYVNSSVELQLLCERKLTN